MIFLVFCNLFFINPTASCIKHGNFIEVQEKIKLQHKKIYVILKINSQTQIPHYQRTMYNVYI